MFIGRSSLQDKTPGHGEIKLCELKEHSKDYRGKLSLYCWNDLWFFKYSLFSPIQHNDASAVAMSASIQKQNATAKAHVLAGHASGRRVHGWKMQEGHGSDILSDLHCTCTICAESKTEAPSLRKFEGARPSVSAVKGEYMTSSDPYISKAMAELQKLDDIEQISDQEDRSDSMHVDAKHVKPVELRRRSTKPREYWHADTVPLGQTWHHIQHALVLVDDFTRMSFVYLLKKQEPICSRGRT